MTRMNPTRYMSTARVTGISALALACLLAAGTVTAQEEAPPRRRSTLSVGVGVIAGTNPYRGADDVSVMAIPTVTYRGRRVQLFGPLLRVNLTSRQQPSAGLTLRYRFAAYEENDSPVLSGLGDRDDTLMAGVQVGARLPYGFRLRAHVEHDVLDRVTGTQAVLGAERPFFAGGVRMSPGAGLKWISSDLAFDDFGVARGKATAARPAYRPGAALNVECSFSAMVRLSGNWQAACTLGAELLDRDLRNSPLVDDRVVTSVFCSVTRAF